MVFVTFAVTKIVTFMVTFCTYVVGLFLHLSLIFTYICDHFFTYVGHNQISEPERDPFWCIAIVAQILRLNGVVLKA